VSNVFSDNGEPELLTDPACLSICTLYLFVGFFPFIKKHSRGLGFGFPPFNRLELLLLTYEFKNNRDS
jgi:hypothetical protein